MITYYVSDIIKRARQLADLENSDFISWNEDIQLLNENYRSMYQKLINKGDKSFIKQIRTGDSDFELPSDFWQLKGVYLWNNGNIILINKRAENESFNSLYYEIVNGVIHINGTHGEVLVEYYATPSTITYPAKAKEINLPETASYNGNSYKITWQAKKNVFFIGSIMVSSAKVWIVYNSVTGNTSSGYVEKTGAFEPVMISDRFLIFRTETKFEIFDFVSEKYVYDASFSDVPLVGADGRLYIYNITDYRFYLASIGASNNLLLRAVTEPRQITTIGKYGYCSKNFENIYSYDFTNYYYNEVELITDDFFLFDFSSGHFVNNELWIKGETYDFGYFAFKENEHELKMKLNGEEYDFFWCYDFNDNSGYGHFVYSFYDGKYYELSFIPDTELNFPNSFYFSLLGYMLAAAYKIKQNADASGIQALIQDQIQTFYDTLETDAFSVSRITNVYR